jgi:hypothetical protein
VRIVVVVVVVVAVVAVDMAVVAGVDAGTRRFTPVASAIHARPLHGSLAATKLICDSKMMLD